MVDSYVNGAPSFITKDVQTVMRTLEQQGHEAVLVGGGVRDLLLGRPVHDYDVATSAHPEQVMGYFRRTVPTGVAHGTVTVVVNDTPCEVTTYRVDLGYSDGRRPDAVRFSTDLREDLLRRDFTINAIAMDRHGHVIDPLNGRADLENACIRAVGDAAERFREDGLRIFRALRLRAQLQFQIDVQTRRAMVANAAQLAGVSSERVGQELAKICANAWPLVLDELAFGPYLEQFAAPISQLQQALGTVRENHLWNSQPGKLLARWTAYCARTGPLVESALHIHQRLLMTLCWWLSAWPAANDSTAEVMMRRFAWPKAWSAHVRSAVKFLNTCPDQWTEQRFAETLLSPDKHALWTACLVGDFLDETDSDTLEQHFLRSWRNMPIHGQRQLAISGRELQDLGFSGPAIGACLRRLTSLVLSHDIANRTTDLLSAANSIWESETRTQ